MMKPVTLHLAKLQKLFSNMLSWITRSNHKNQYGVELYWELVSCVADDQIYMLRCTKVKNKNILRLY
jgi:hypothetical protein